MTTISKKLDAQLKEVIRIIMTKGIEKSENMDFCSLLAFELVNKLSKKNNSVSDQDTTINSPQIVKATKKDDSKKTKEIKKTTLPAEVKSLPERGNITSQSDSKKDVQKVSSILQRKESPDEKLNIENVCSKLTLTNSEEIIGNITYYFKDGATTKDVRMLFENLSRTCINLNVCHLEMAELFATVIYELSSRLKSKEGSGNCVRDEFEMEYDLSFLDLLEKMVRNVTCAEHVKRQNEFRMMFYTLIAGNLFIKGIFETEKIETFLYAFFNDCLVTMNEATVKKNEKFVHYGVVLLITCGPQLTSDIMNSYCSLITQIWKWLGEDTSSLISNLLYDFGKKFLRTHVTEKKYNETIEMLSESKQVGAVGLLVEYWKQNNDASIVEMKMSNPPSKLTDEQYKIYARVIKDVLPRLSGCFICKKPEVHKLTTFLQTSTGATLSTLIQKSLNTTDSCENSVGDKLERFTKLFIVLVKEGVCTTKCVKYTLDELLKSGNSDRRELYFKVGLELLEKIGSNLKETVRNKYILEFESAMLNMSK